MGLLMFLLFLILYILLELNKRNSLLLIFIYLTLAPLIKIENITFDASYLVIIFLIIILIIKHKKIVIMSEFKSYYNLFIFNFLLYLFSTLLHISSISGIENIIGFIKMPILYILITSIYKETEEIEFKKYITITLLLNLIVCIIQIMTKDQYLSFFKLLYSEGHDQYSTISGIHAYARTYGLFASPVYLGTFCLFAFTYLLKNARKNIFEILLSIFVGLSSATKTFILGVPIVIIVYIMKNIFINKSIRLRKNTIILLVSIVVCMPFLISIFNYAVNLLSQNGIYIKYYLNYLSNPVEALSTRYSYSNDILLSKCFEVIKKNLLIGVGFYSIEGEFLGDSTYVLALHNGGIISIVSIISFYVKYFYKSLKQNRNSMELLLIWIFSGIGDTTLFNKIYILPFIYYLFFSIKKINNK